MRPPSTVFEGTRKSDADRAANQRVDQGAFAIEIEHRAAGLPRLRGRGGDIGPRADVFGCRAGKPNNTMKKKKKTPSHRAKGGGERDHPFILGERKAGIRSSALTRDIALGALESTSRKKKKKRGGNVQSRWRVIAFHTRMNRDESARAASALLSLEDAWPRGGKEKEKREDGSASRIQQSPTISTGKKQQSARGSLSSFSRKRCPGKARRHTSLGRKKKQRSQRTFSVRRRHRHVGRSPS